MQGASKAEQYFQPGEIVPESGVYTVLHHGHRQQHPATIFKGDRFPSCARCGTAVRFMLARSAALISEDLDFSPSSAKGQDAP